MKKWLYLIGLGISSIFAALWLFILISNFALSPTVPEGQGLGFLFVAVLCIISTIGAWFKTRVGGLMMMISGLAFSFFIYLVADKNPWFGVMISGAPFFIGGLLVMISGIYRPRKKSSRPAI